jgi:probable rRNA maturation factor
MTIQLQNSSANLPEVNLDLLHLAIELTLRRFNRSDVDITLRLTDDTEMKMLNRMYRNEEKTTDVLSFNEDYTDPETGQFYLGDIVISINQAAIQAANQDHSLDEECAFLAIHGTLHLLGFDHYEPKEKAEMWSLQDELFKEVLASFKKGQP